MAFRIAAMYSMSAGSPMPRVSFCGSSCSYIRRSDSVIPGSPPVNICDQLAGPVADGLRLGRGRVDAPPAQVGELGVDLPPLLLDGLHLVLAERRCGAPRAAGAARACSTSRTSSSPPWRPGAARVDVPAAVDGGEEPCQPEAQLLEEARRAAARPGPDAAARCRRSRPRSPSSRPDLLERQADLTQRQEACTAAPSAAEYSRWPPWVRSDGTSSPTLS